MLHGRGSHSEGGNADEGHYCIGTLPSLRSEFETMRLFDDNGLLESRLQDPGSSVLCGHDLRLSDKFCGLLKKKPLLVSLLHGHRGLTIDHCCMGQHGS